MVNPSSLAQRAMHDDRPQFPGAPGGLGGGPEGESSVAWPPEFAPSRKFSLRRLIQRKSIAIFRKDG
eukprot:3484197-Amphidinium_carterae.1